MIGRNPVVEALRAGVPATALYVAQGLSADERVTEAVHEAAGRGIALLEISRNEMDRLTGNGIHQGLALKVPPYDYAHPEDLGPPLSPPGRNRCWSPSTASPIRATSVRSCGRPRRSGRTASSCPERRSAGMTASAWRTSAGTAARIPVARCTNLVRTLKDLAENGAMIVGLDADGTTEHR